MNITLIVLLIIIWSSVFYKYFGGNKSSIKSNEAISSTINYKQKYAIAKDTFQLSLIDRDPFGISSRMIKTPIAKKTVNKPKVTAKTIQKNIVWPNITYHGFVKGENETTRLILLKIDKILFRKREKEIVNDITLVKAYNDSLIVSLNNNKKTIKKQ
nr:hypothetical protein [Mariniflexile sp. KMM 9835]